jgi:N6-adenosine-specific RNA methylase IME4
MGRILTHWPKSSYGTILADPPWPLRGGKGGRQGYSKTMSADVQYPLMSFRQIESLRVGDVAMPDSHLYLWTVSMYLPEALAVMRAWGFRYVTNLSWYMDDQSVGLGQYFRTKHQLCLFGVRGQPPYARDDKGKRPCVDSAFPSPRRRHSQKPWDVHEAAELVSPGPRIELFARQPRKGWDSWGNELLRPRA